VDDHEARRRFAGAAVARLATADRSGRPHIVPIVFALSPPGAGAADHVYSAVDHKPKRSTALRRLANVEENPSVALLVDHYGDDWDELWWVRADGLARVVGPATDEAALARRLLADRYPQYRDRPPSGPVLAVRVVRWSGWSARG